MIIVDLLNKKREASETLCQKLLEEMDKNRSQKNVSVEYLIKRFSNKDLSSDLLHRVFSLFADKKTYTVCLKDFLSCF